jgi:uncharacterized protein (TIGR04255 family)
MENLPLKIKHDLITEALLELRFDSSFPPEAIFGIIYQIISKKYPNIQNVPLPILQLPEAIRNADPNFKYQPHNRLQKDVCGFNIGPNVISFFVQKPYIGWDKWKPIITEILNELMNIEGLFKIIERIGLRYINLIDRSIFSVANINIKIIDKVLDNEQTNFRTEYTDGNYVKIVQIFNNANILVNNKPICGSLIDIDIIRDLRTISIQNFKSKMEEILEESHNKEKILFFSLLKTDFLNELEPTYE